MAVRGDVSPLNGTKLTILLVQFIYLEAILATENAIIVEFIPGCQCCKLRTRNTGERMQVEAVYNRRSQEE